MKTILTLLLLCISSLYSEEYILDQAGASSMDLTNPDVNNSNSVRFIKYDVNTSEDVDLKESIMVNAANRFGVFKLNKEINASNQESMKGMINAIKLNMPTSGNSLSSQLLSKTTKMDTTDATTLTNQNIIDDDANSTQSKVLGFTQPFEIGMRSRVGNLKTIDCYATRKLVNSYFCPLPSLSNSFFKGGAFKDSKAEAQDACNELCKEPSTCLSKDMNKQDENIEEYSDFNLEGKDESIVVNIDDGMKVKSMTVTLSSRYDYEDGISLNQNDYNSSMASEALQNSSHGVAFKIEKWNVFEEKYELLFSSMNMKILDINSELTLHTSGLRSNKIRISFYEPWMVSDGTKKEDPKLHVQLASTKVSYVDNKWWFCSSTQLKTNAADCDGELKTITIQGAARKVCVTQSAQLREPEYGAYYTKESCQRACVVRAKCLPTYRHLESFNPYSLPDELKDIEIGCSDNPRNTSCTKELCEKLFLEDRMPLVEKTWINDDSIKLTVAHGVQQDGIARPRIDVEGGLSSNGNPEERKKVSLNEMSEVSYINMIEGDTYGVSAKNIGVNIPSKSGYRKKSSGGVYSLYWDMKPNSYDVDNDKIYYLYNVFEVVIMYRPMYGVYNTATGLQSGEEDDAIKIKDKLYVVKTPSGFKIIKRVENVQGRFCTLSATNTLGDTYCPVENHEWIKMSAYEREEYVTYSSSLENLVSYSIGDKADYFASMKFSSDHKYESFHVFDSIESFMQTEGLQIHSQKAISNGRAFKKVFSGAIGDLDSSDMVSVNVYGIYSDAELSYGELLNKTTKDKMYYSTIVDMPSRLVDDKGYGTDRVKMYISGKPDKMSVNIDINPTYEEEGRKSFIFMLLYDE